MRTFTIIAAFMISNAVYEANGIIMDNNVFTGFLFIAFLAFGFDLGLYLDKLKNKKK